MPIYFPRSLKGFLPRRKVFSTWYDHLSFGYDLVGAFQPSSIVELGTFTGQSYFTFCQSVLDHEFSCRCYAVDTWAWTPDYHMDPYDESVYSEVKDYNDSNYSTFSTLMRMEFEEAAESFSDASIDLLHIDGHHTYEAARGDYETWLPKVAPGGIILFHDTCARVKDYGVWRLWSEIRKQHPSFEFKHGFGLGVIRKQGGERRSQPLLDLLFDDNEERHHQLRNLYVYASHLQTLEGRNRVYENVQNRLAKEKATGGSQLHDEMKKEILDLKSTQSDEFERIKAEILEARKRQPKRN